MDIALIGAFLPRLTPDRVARFIEDDRAEFVSTMRELRQRGLVQASDEELDLRAKETRLDLRDVLERVALFELRVKGAGSNFDVYDFHEPNTTQVAWEPAWLSEDGESELCESHSGPPKLSDFRVAFYIHEWPEGGQLIGPNGPIPVTSFQAVPERLWRLAKYALVD